MTITQFIKNRVSKIAAWVGVRAQHLVGLRGRKVGKMKKIGMIVGVIPFGLLLYAGFPLGLIGLAVQLTGLIIVIFFKDETWEW